jgi:uncharacterized MnhB-related membrane protein
MDEFWVLMHLAGVSAFLIIHGVQMWMMFALRPSFPDRARIFDRAEISRRATLPMYVSLAVLLVFGVVAALSGGWFSGNAAWLWGSIVVLLIVTGLMSVMATGFMRRVREATTQWADGSYGLDDEDLKALLDGPHVALSSAIGGAGLLVILWLMVFKPGA